MITAAELLSKPKHKPRAEYLAPFKEQRVRVMEMLKTMSKREVGKALGISRERVRQIYNMERR